MTEMHYVVTDGRHEIVCDTPMEALAAATELFPSLVVSIIAPRQYDGQPQVGELLDNSQDRLTHPSQLSDDLPELTPEDRAAVAEALTAILEDLNGEAS